MNTHCKTIRSTQEFIAEITEDYYKWGTNYFPWFRGEPDKGTPLLPKLYRKKLGEAMYNENQLVQYFRRMAPVFSQSNHIERGETDLWLFLMQHVGMPTRLLDWSGGALIALYFALRSKTTTDPNPIVWMLNPGRLIELTVGKTIPDNSYALTWVDTTRNIGARNIHAAWTSDKETATDLPVPILPTNLHPRMAAQKSCFTIHGKRQESLNQMVGEDCLLKYIIDADTSKMISELRILGITHSSLFPDLDGLATELESTF